jgi:hypothetical protein
VDALIFLYHTFELSISLCTLVLCILETGDRKKGKHQTDKSECRVHLEFALSLTEKDEANGTDIEEGKV